MLLVGLGFSRAFGLRPPSVLSHMRPHQEARQQDPPARQSHSLLRLSHGQDILSQGPYSVCQKQVTQGEEILEYQGWEPQGNISEAAHHKEHVYIVNSYIMLVILHSLTISVKTD